MYKKSVSMLVIAALISALFIALFNVAVARADDWTQVAKKGIDGGYTPFAQMITSTTQDSTDYYVGTQTIPGGFQIWRYNSSTWTNIAKEGLGNRNNVGVASMCIYNGKLYAGITRAAGMWNGTSLFAFDGSHWTEITSNAFGNENVQSFTSMEIFQGKLYVGTFNTQEGTLLFSFDGTDWSRANTDGYGAGAASKDTNWLASDGNDLYAGVRNDATGCRLYRFDGGTAWTQLGTNGFGDADNSFTPAGYAYGTELGAYILMGTTNQTTGAQLWLYDVSQSTFTQVNESGFGDAAGWYIGAITFYGGNFYVGVDRKDEHGGATPCQLWSFPGTDWTGWQGKWVQRLAGGVPGAPAIATAITSLDNYRDRMFMTVMCPGWPVEVFSTLDAGNWTLMAKPGWLTHYNQIAWSLATYNGDLYAGTHDPYTGCEIYRRDADGWTAVETGGFGSPDPNWTVSNMVEYSGYLYAGTGTGINDACGVYRYDGTSWAQVNINKFGNNKNNGVGAMAVWDGRLYVSTINGAEVWCYDGSSWTRVGSGFDGAEIELAVHQGRLYGGTLAGDWAGQVFRYEGGNTWKAVSEAGFDIDGNVTTLTSYNGKLYAGLMGKQSKKCHVYVWDGRLASGWKSVAEPGFGTDNGRITSAAVFNGKLYMATDDTTTVFSYDGSKWARANTDGFGDKYNHGESSMAVVGNSLFVGTDNYEYGAQIWQTEAAVPPVPIAPFYFAEGTTRPGFETYFSIENPAKTAANVHITYMKGDGTQQEQAISVPATSRATIHPADVLGVGDDAAHDFSAKVESTNGIGIVAERPMYFDYKGEWPGGHDVVGANSPDSEWYFAEGTTRPGFDAYLTVCNPGTTPAAVQATYMKGDGKTATQSITVPPASRGTLHPADVIGVGDDAAHDFSAKVESTNGVRIVAERPMYFNYQGRWTGGSDVVGANAPAPVWYFAEGTCRTDFSPYICVQNPGTETADIVITYMTGNGTTRMQTASVSARSRSTIDPRSVLGSGDDTAWDFSAKVECTNGSVICERPTYFDYNGWPGGHDVMGATSPASIFYFAEGTARPGFDAYLSVQNPDDSSVNVSVTYLKGDGKTATQNVTVAARARATLHPADVVGVGSDSSHDFSATVTCDPGRQVIVERPMYFDYYGWTGGSDVVGYTP